MGIQDQLILDQETATEMDIQNQLLLDQDLSDSDDEDTRDDFEDEEIDNVSYDDPVWIYVWWKTWTQTSKFDQSLFVI